MENIISQRNMFDPLVKDIFCFDDQIGSILETKTGFKATTIDMKRSFTAEYNDCISWLLRQWGNAQAQKEYRNELLKNQCSLF